MRWPLIVLVAAMCAASGCANSPRNGHLIIAGGAVQADNATIYSAFMAPLPADAVIGVVPTASASPAESAAASAKTIAGHAAGRRIVTIDISLAKPEAANDPAVVKAIDQCSGLWFTGGVQSRILKVFRPASGDTPAYEAARRLLARGGAIGGTSAGAAMMSDPMITGGASEDALSGNIRIDDEDSGLGISTGMGFFPFGLVDQHFLKRGRIGRLIVALERTGQNRGYGVEENSAIDVDLARGRLTALGPVVAVDVSRMKRSGQSLSGVRVSLLHEGDVVDARTGGITPRGRRADSTSKPSGTEPLPAAWSAGALEVALARASEQPGTPVELASAGFVLRIATDEETSVWVHENRVSTLRARLEIAAKGQRE